MIAYNFDPVTHEYTGRETAPENPRRPGEYLIPAHSTLTEPPEIRKGYARIWNGEAWDHAEDHRGETVWQNHEISREITALGPIPEGWTAERPPKTITRKDITEKIYEAKAKKAYRGITINKSGIDYIFATDLDSISLCNAVLISISTGIQSVNWKVWRDSKPEILTLNASEFRAIFAAGMTMIQTAFAIEAELNEEYANKTDAEISALTEAEVDANISSRFDTLHPVIEV